VQKSPAFGNLQNVTSNNMSDIIIPNDTTKIVLGHPLSGALYAYFDKELNEGRHIESSKTHSYYKTLYGKHFETYIDIALTLSLIYDTVILPAADNSFPDFEKYESNGEYYNPEFGLYFTWRDEANYRHIVNDKIQRAIADKEVSALLWNIPKHVHEQIISEVYFELSMANKFNATLFTLGRRQALAKRIAEIENEKTPDLSETSKIKVVSSYLDITGLLFQPMDIQSFYYLKTEKDLREYSTSFLKVVEDFAPENPTDIKRELLLLIKEAISKDKLHSKISGVFEGSSTIMNYVGLIPVAGTVAGLVGIGTDWAARGVDKLNERHKWYELASQIEKIKSMERINAALKDIK
jgi:hypothetical protein